MIKTAALSIFLAMALCLWGTAISPSHAEIFNKRTPSAQSQQQKKAAPTEREASGTAVEYARRVARACVPGKWEKQSCLKALSENNLVMVANYGEALQNRKKDSAAELLKEHCAASTAATRGEYPAYAMRSAFVECANIIYDITESARILPDQSQYQLLVGAVQCLDKTVACAGIEKGLSHYK